MASESTTEVSPGWPRYTHQCARACGELCRTAQSADPIDAGVVLNATGAVSLIVTSDEGNIGRLIDALGSDVGTGSSILKT